MRTDVAGASMFRVLHTTDFSHASDVAFAHALRLALAAGAELSIMHVTRPGNWKAEQDWVDFPGIRHALQRWTLPAGSAPGEPVDLVGLRTGKILGFGADPVRSVLDYLRSHPTELIVLAAHQRTGFERWVHKPAAGPIARGSGEMTLFVPEGVDGFVSRETGAVTLNAIVIPVDTIPAPQAAVDSALTLLDGLGCSGTTVTVLHVGDEPSIPEVRIPEPDRWTWRRVTRGREPVEEIIRAAEEASAGLIVMVTEGRHGFLDACRGSTTERVLRRAPCPVLAVPAGSRAMARLFSGRHGGHEPGVLGARDGH
jgi:nucleotide-binding universal stress UspA family protein